MIDCAECINGISPADFAVFVRRPRRAGPIKIDSEAATSSQLRFFIRVYAAAIERRNKIRP